MQRQPYGVPKSKWIHCVLSILHYCVWLSHLLNFFLYLFSLLLLPGVRLLADVEGVVEELVQFVLGALVSVRVPLTASRFSCSVTG